MGPHYGCSMVPGAGRSVGGGDRHGWFGTCRADSGRAGCWRGTHGHLAWAIPAPVARREAWTWIIVGMQGILVVLVPVLLAGFALLMDRFEAAILAEPEKIEA